ncbi:MAG: flagellar biosynthetic protein FliR [Gammaproteobacteria bacterium]
MFTDLTTLWDWIAEFLIHFMRIGAVFSVAPVLGSSMIPANIRIALAVPITAWITLVTPQDIALAQLDPLSISGFLLMGGQVLIGIAIGFLLRMVFEALAVGGQILSMQMGLGFAEMSDPQSGARVPTLGHLYNVLGTLVFLALDGHLALIRLLAESYTLMPVSAGSLSPLGAHELVAWGATLFQGAVMLALPAIAALLAVNVAAGVMTRAVPQFNMMIAFPLILLLGLVALGFTLGPVSEQFIALLDDAWETIATVLTQNG